MLSGLHLGINLRAFVINEAPGHNFPYLIPLFILTSLNLKHIFYLLLHYFNLFSMLSKRKLMIKQHTNFTVLV